MRGKSVEASGLEHLRKNVGCPTFQSPSTHSLDACFSRDTSKLKAVSQRLSGPIQGPIVASYMLTLLTWTYRTLLAGRCGYGMGPGGSCALS
eukprot:4246330-Amphidinium_carterae.1